MLPSTVTGADLRAGSGHEQRDLRERSGRPLSTTLGSAAAPQGFPSRAVVRAVARPMASSTTMLRAPATRKYGGRFGNGFGQYLRDSTLADVTIVAPDGREHQAHMLLLSYHSEFFKRAFSADFKEKEERRVSLGFEDPAGALSCRPFVHKGAIITALGTSDAWLCVQQKRAGVWPLLLEFFYTDEIVLTDETVLPLLAMSRELMVKSIEVRPRSSLCSTREGVPSRPPAATPQQAAQRGSCRVCRAAPVQEYCSDYAQNSLEASNAIQYLNQAVQFNCDSFRQSCVALVAEGFPSSFNKPTDGLPSEVRSRGREGAPTRTRSSSSSVAAGRRRRT